MNNQDMRWLLYAAEICFALGFSLMLIYLERRPSQFWLGVGMLFVGSITAISLRALSRQR